jgi:hypothetical protein
MKSFCMAAKPHPSPPLGGNRTGPGLFALGPVDLSAVWPSLALHFDKLSAGFCAHPSTALRVTPPRTSTYQKIGEITL